MLRYADGSYARGGAEQAAAAAAQTGAAQAGQAANTAANAQEYVLWEKVDGSWWAFGADGRLKTGFFYCPTYADTFFIDEFLGMRSGWVLIGNKWYYFAMPNDPNGKAVGSLYVNTVTPDGYRVDATGARID